MQGGKVVFVFLSLVLCGVHGTLHECGEFNTQRTKFEDYFNVFENSNNQNINEVFKLMENISNYNAKHTFLSDAPIKYVPDRIKAEGYPVEVHEIFTDDGYILEMHRIPHGNLAQTDQTRRPPVLLVHAFLQSSSDWTILGAKNSLAYLLADTNYDCWMLNVRGTEVSQRHTRYNPNGRGEKEYWNFSWHEMGMYDVAAAIDYILNETKFEKLNYIGYSQGSIAFLILTSMKPEYNNKIIEGNLVAPASYLKGTTNLFYQSFAKSYRSIKLMARFKHKLIFNNEAFLKIGLTACKNIVNSTPKQCMLILNVLNSNQVNCSTLPLILVGTPSGALSMRLSLHYLQSIRNGGFRQFDYENKRMNEKVYGRDTPPEYDLAKITAPINIFHSKDDDTSIYSNVIQLQSQLPNVKSRYVVPIVDFGHVDFLYSRYARNGLYNKLISTINKANWNN
ncbi:lipase 3-like [Contarinia nasturtii]|uniref:lipase 3-like n=1 Tax=Contarinia nasturtii TaxID=265458 RepID=UPI0012D44427|nr:lipase 3-like [Contarinia nasturtii]